MDLGSVFVRNMKKYRKQAGLSQAKLAEQCEASHSFIRQIECGSRYPSFSFIARLADEMHIPPSWLFVDETDPRLGDKARKQAIEKELLKNITKDVRAALGKI
ncbi:MAG: helix-turn-helix domain-containing protein [Spirochaetaceae bacterium]|jgi:transcriptional regulator with XRE-family HTH domain|nr:helix-turn-helix domain-containing protein [Spirochaetaceae bacterium]